MKMMQASTCTKAAQRRHEKTYFYPGRSDTGRVFLEIKRSAD